MPPPPPAGRARIARQAPQSRSRWCRAAEAWPGGRRLATSRAPASRVPTPRAARRRPVQPRASPHVSSCPSPVVISVLSVIRRERERANRGFRPPSARAKADALLKSTGDSQQMARLQLSFACGLYDRMQPLYTGEVKVEGIDLNFIAIDQPRPIFDRMSGGEEFDVAEYSSSEFVQRFANRQCPFVALPVFPSRAFRHGFIAVHRKAGIKAAKDLEGKRVGVPLLTRSAAIYINGLLQHEYGVDLRKIHWVQGAVNHPGSHGKPTVLPLLQPMPIEIDSSGRSLSDLLEARVIDATLGTSLPEAIRTNPDIARLFPDYVELEKEHY